MTAFESYLLSLRDFDQRPYAQDGFTYYAFKKGFENGSRIAFNDSERTVDSSEPPLIPKRQVKLETAEGVTFEYIEGKRVIMVINRPGLDAPRELDPAETIETTMQAADSDEPAELINVRFVGGANHPLRQRIAAFREAQEKGTDTLTEGKVKEFTKAIDAAISSGIAVEQPDLTYFAIW
jgi:hypothetical protein